jgi:hypothetical protein
VLDFVKNFSNSMKKTVIIAGESGKKEEYKILNWDVKLITVSAALRYN